MNNSKDSRKTGIEAENVICNILENQGWTIITRNFHTRYGEIDIIAIDGTSLVFIEVKSATRPNPLLSGKVNKTKQNRMILAASGYLQKTDVSRFSEIRFDVITAVRKVTGDWRLTHIRNAFCVEDGQ